MNKSGIAMSTSVPTGKHLLESIKPCEKTFDPPSSFVSVQRTSVLCGCTFAIGFMWGDQLNALGSKLLTERITIVGAIPNKSFGSSHDDNFIEGSFDKV